MDDTTARDDRGTDRESSRGPSRRALLATVGSVGVASALAGCDTDLTSQEFEATPVVLTGEGQELLGLPEFELSESTRTESVGDVGEVTATSYLSIHSRPAEGEPPLRFDEPDPRFRRVGVLSTPSPELVGGVINPFASEPLDELVAGEEGREFLARTGVLGTSDFEWQDGPRPVDTRDVEFLGETTQARSYMGIALGGEAGPMTVLLNLARIQHEGDVVVAGEFVRRTTPVDPLEVGSACVDDLCQMPAPEQVDMWRRYQRAGAYLATCQEIVVGGRVTEVCGTSGSTPEHPALSITNARLVQHVEDTVVKPPGDSVSHTEADPDLVAGENTAVVFEFDTLDDLDQLDGDLAVEVTHGDRNAPDRTTERFQLSKSDLEDVRDGTHTMAVLHGSDNPVFELTDDASIVIDSEDHSGYGFWERINARSTVDLDPLTVGFIAIQDEDDGDRYGDTQGRPRAYRRSYESASEYLRRAYPGDVVTYGHSNHLVLGKSEVKERTNIFGVTTRPACDDQCVVYRDMKRVQRELNRIATDASYPKQGSGFPGGGILHTDGVDRSSIVSEIQNSGFDVVVAIVPGNDSSNPGATDYYNYHNMSASGLAFGDPDAAVSSRGASASGGDQRICATVAQEVGHYFQDDYRGPSGDPMAQRRNDDDDDDQPTVNGNPIDPAHARNQGSSRVSGGDPPGVVSTAYDLADGFANLQSYRNPGGAFSVTGPASDATEIGKSPSYMSYTGADHRAWADARIHQQLIDSRWSVSGTSGSDSPAFVISGDGFVADDGSVYYDDVVAYRGVERYTDVDDGAVTVELLGPGGEVLERARVPIEIGTSHHDGFVGGTIRAPSFTLPFAETGVRVRTTLEGVRTPMNPIERSVRDAVRRVPEAGFRGEAAESRESIGRALDDVAAAMADGDYAEAAETMAEPVRNRILEGVREYEARLDEPSLEGLLDLVDEMIRRLQLVAEVAG